MGCQNGKLTNTSLKQKADQFKILIEQFNIFQQDIVCANLHFQIKTNPNKKNYEKQNSNNSDQTNDNSMSEDLNTAFLNEMISFQAAAKDLLSKATNLLEQNEYILSEALCNKLKEKVNCLYEFAYILQLDTTTKPSEKEIQGLGDLCESIIVA